MDGSDLRFICSVPISDNDLSAIGKLIGKQDKESNWTDRFDCRFRASIVDNTDTIINTGLVQFVRHRNPFIQSWYGYSVKRLPERIELLNSSVFGNMKILGYIPLSQEMIRIDEELDQQKKTGW